MKDDIQKKAQLYPVFVKSYCKVFLCNNPADYWLGRPDGPAHKQFPICKHHVKEILDNLPVDLKTAMCLREVSKKYYCECGEGFDTPVEKASHCRQCQVHKEAK